MGGSQGARRLNQAVWGSLGALLDAYEEVVHVTGRQGEETAAALVRPGYRPIAFTDDMPGLLATADLVVCRAGVGTCAELTAVGLPAAYVPLPHGNGEQRLNAEPIEEAGGGLIIDDADLSPEWLAETLLPILLDGELVAAMGQAAAASGNRDADRDLAALVLSVGRGPRPARQARRASQVSRAGRGPRSGAAPGRAPRR